MPSRKKARGKARKAAKAKKDEDSVVAVATAQADRNSQHPLDQFPNLLQLPLEIDLSMQRYHDGECCFHGYIPPAEEDLCHQFICDFVSKFNSTMQYCAEIDLGLPGIDTAVYGNVPRSLFMAFYDEEKKYGNYLWKDSKNIKLLIAHFLARGTQAILNGNINGARACAAVACRFDDLLAVNVASQEHKPAHSHKIQELYMADIHTLVKYLKNLIPCKCLDIKYKEVKSTTKMGICNNHNCNKPNRRVERSTMLYCARCRNANYCSRECQVADWPFHKERSCGKDVADILNEMTLTP
mmetsp:Transcript_27764/g.41797  ORF Transcript_27764/g.41797 Transcript_27764/m.41797 type:complete len:297 (+) Transcript_27764:51-941(+)